MPGVKAQRPLPIFVETASDDPRGVRTSGRCELDSCADAEPPWRRAGNGDARGATCARLESYSISEAWVLQLNAGRC